MDNELESNVSKREVPDGSPRFAITDHKGVQFTFANGITISIQWGPQNYCADYWDFKTLESFDAPRQASAWKSPDAEVALWRARNARWCTKEAYAALNNGEDCGDDVLPALSPDEVARYIAWAASQPKAK
jgi:hypothetical protein